MKATRKAAVIEMLYLLTVVRTWAEKNKRCRSFSLTGPDEQGRMIKVPNGQRMSTGLLNLPVFASFLGGWLLWQLNLLDPGPDIQ